MKIHKAIVRLDYPFCYELVDSIGRALKMLVVGSPDEEEFWQTMGVGADGTSLSCRYDDQHVRRQISAFPQALLCQIEFNEGVDISAMQEHPVYRRITKSMDDFISHFKIDNILRIGLRCWIVELSKQNDDQLDTSNRSANPETLVTPGQTFFHVPHMLNSDLVSDFDTSFGGISSSGVTLSGRLEYDVGYTVSAGILRNDLTSPVSQTVGMMTLDGRSVLPLDVDLYQENLNFKALSIRRWTRDRWEIVNKLAVRMSEGFEE